MKKITGGIIGAGLIGQDHLEKYENLDGAEVVALCDNNETQLKLKAEKFNIPHSFVKC